MPLVLRKRRAESALPFPLPGTFARRFSVQGERFCLVIKHGLGCSAYALVADWMAGMLCGRYVVNPNLDQTDIIGRYGRSEKERSHTVI